MGTAPDSLKQGHAFLWVQAGVGAHLWAVLSDPKQDQERILVVNFTSWVSYADPSCVVEAGEHPFIKHRSWVKYDAAMFFTAEHISRYTRAQPPLSEQLLDKVIQGAESTLRLAIEQREFLVGQGIIV